MAQEGDTSDRPWACVQLYQQLLYGSEPTPSTFLLELCFSRSTWDCQRPPSTMWKGGVGDPKLYHGFSSAPERGVN